MSQQTAVQDRVALVDLVGAACENDAHSPIIPEARRMPQGCGRGSGSSAPTLGRITSSSSTTSAAAISGQHGQQHA